MLMIACIGTVVSCKCDRLPYGNGLFARFCSFQRTYATVIFVPTAVVVALIGRRVVLHTCVARRKKLLS